MKTYIYFLIVLMIIAVESTFATTVNKIYQWPYSSQLPFLQPSPNSVATGLHSAYSNGIVIWAVGDTISVLNAADLTDEIASFRVSTKTVINGLYYKADDGSETLYLAVGVNGLQIYDFSSFPPTRQGDGYSISSADPGYQPNIDTAESEATTTIDARGIGYNNNRIFLADNNFGLRVIDVSDMTAPFETLLDPPINIDLGTEWVYNQSTGHYEYEDQVITRTSGYIQPNVVGSYDTTGGYVNIDVLPFDGKTYAVVHDYYYGIRVFDVTDPTIIEEPVSKFLGTQDWLQYYALVNDVHLAVGSDYGSPSSDRLYAYITAVDTLSRSVVSRFDILSTETEIIGGEDVTIPLNWNKGRCVTPGTASGVYMAGDHAYVADAASGLQVVDITTGVRVNDDSPDEAPVLDYLSIESYGVDTTNALSLVGDAGNYIFLHDTLAGLHKIEVDVQAHDDVTTSLEETAAPPISGDTIYVEGDYAYCFDSDVGLRIFNTSEPSALTQEGFFGSVGTVNDIFVLGNYAYIVKANPLLEIVNVTNKSEPEIAASIATGGSASAVKLYEHVSGSTYACIADGTSGLSVIDVSTPATPVATVGVTGAGTANDVCISGDLAYIANGSEGLKIVNLSAAPTYTVSGTVINTGDATAVAVYDNGTTIYACIAVGGQILIEDVTNPVVAAVSAPEETIDPEDGFDVASFVSLEVVDNYLIAAAGSDGVFAYDLSVLPAAPVRIGAVISSFSSVDVSSFQKDDTFYFMSAEEANGIGVYNLSLGRPDAEPLGDTKSDAITCFISILADQ